MKGEIDRDWYCAKNAHENIKGVVGYSCSIHGVCYRRCAARHRKWPTPEQFKEEYGEEWQDDWAVYDIFDDGSFTETWGVTLYSASKRFILTFDKLAAGNKCLIVCACTSWGKPPDDWRPE